MLIAAKHSLPASTSILNLVTLVIIVGIFEECVFNYVRESSDYPYVKELFTNGRLLYIQNTLTTSKMLDMMEEHVTAMKSEMTEMKNEMTEMKEEVIKFFSLLLVISSLYDVYINI